MSELALRGISVLGLPALVALAWLFSTARGRMPWRTVFWGLG